LAFLVVLGPLLDEIIVNRALQSAVWNGLPWILVVLVVCKMIAASWVAIRLNDSRLLSDRALVACAAGWLVIVVALYGVLEWCAASPLIPHYFLGAIAILMVPLARVSAAPLALASSRHR
jgi:CDP-diglyceride synthetase